MPSHRTTDFPPLDVLQHWMQAVLIRGETPTAGEQQTVGELVTSSRSLSADDRWAVYARAYVARLLDCLKAEFPAVRHAAGEEGFAGLAYGYLAGFPSHSYTLSELGRQFPDYLQATRPVRDTADGEPDFAEFLIELARLERCYSEVFDGPGPERQPASQWSCATAADFALSRLEFHESVRLLKLQFSCHEYASAVRQGQEPAPPTADSCRLVVFRRDFVVRRMVLTPFEWELLTALWHGATVQQSLQQALVADNARTSTAEAVQQAFRRWTAAPLFRQLGRTIHS